MSPPTRGASPPGRIQLTVELQSGENHLLLYNPVVTRADSSYLQYARMGRELQEATKEWAVITGEEERPIIYSICEWGLSLQMGSQGRQYVAHHAGYHAQVAKH